MCESTTEICTGGEKVPMGLCNFSCRRPCVGGNTGAVATTGEATISPHSSSSTETGAVIGGITGAVGLDRSISNRPFDSMGFLDSLAFPGINMLEAVGRGCNGCDCLEGESALMVECTTV